MAWERGPSCPRRRNPLIHHKVRSYDTQLRVFQQLTVGWTVLDDPENACREIDRVLRLCKRFSRPVYIELPRDMVDVEVELEPHALDDHVASDPRTLGAALTEATAWINRARQPVIFFGVELYRFGLEAEALALIEASGIPAAVTLLDKGAIEERSPHFLGVYAGALGRDDVRAYVESSDCVVMLGTLLTDINLGIETAKLDPAKCIHITRERLAVGLHTYENVGLADFVCGLADGGITPRSNRDHPRAPEPHPDEVIGAERDEPITVAHLFARLQCYLNEDTIVIADPGDEMEYPDQVDDQAAAFHGAHSAAPTKGLARTKQAIYASPNNTFDAQLALEGAYMRECGFSEDYREGVAAFKEKRSPKFQGR